MASITHPANHCGGEERTVPLGATLARVIRRLTGAFAGIAQRDTDREIARIVRRSGGRLTDSMEREIMQKALVSYWSLPN